MFQPANHKSSGIFICYRREDSSFHAERLCERLVDHFGRHRIFMDIDTIQPGEKFRKVIEDAIESCEVLIVIIGSQWLGTTGNNRLVNRDDFVRIEIATALSHGVRVIPVLVQNATMPSAVQLPDDIKNLVDHHGIELSNKRWRDDVAELIQFLDDLIKSEEVDRPVEVAKTGGGARSLKTLAKSKFAVGALIAAVFLVVLFAYGRKLFIPQTTTDNIKPFMTVDDPLRDMVLVPGGRFRMGSNDADVNERPPHEITVSRFYIDQHEVTCDEYAKFVLTGHAPPSGCANGQFGPSVARKPVTGVTWDDAQAYCGKYRKRLPTEAEWEFAARGATGYRYPWGDDWRPGMANVEAPNLGLIEVGTLSGVSPYGAVDMIGNAWEWTATDLAPYPGGRLGQKLQADLKVIRGGSFIDSRNQATTTYRRGYPARVALDFTKIGFRCVRSIS
jgi:formylglycine-generating enzyme required for sulfatase activity